MSGPFFQNHVFCCTNRREPGNSRGSCAERGSEALRDYMKDKMKKAGVPSSRVNTAGCLDRCEHGPVMVIYPEGVWYTYKNKEDVDEIVAEHLQNGRIVERLKLPEQA